MAGLVVRLTERGSVSRSAGDQTNGLRVTDPRSRAAMVFLITLWSETPHVVS